MNLGELVTTLGLDATPLKQAQAELRSLSQAAASAASAIDLKLTSSTKSAATEAQKASSVYKDWLGGTASQANAASSNLLALVGVTASVAGAAVLAKKAWDAWLGLVSSGVSAIDQYKMSIYGTASALATMSDVSGPKDEAYSQWKNYLEWLRREANIADREAAASGKEIFETATAFGRYGVVAMTREQIKVISNFTDELKSQLKGMAGGTEMFMRQANQEVRALMEGRQVAGAQMAMLFDKLDPKWKENFENARRSGTVLEYINSVLPRIEEKVRDISNTWESVTSTLENIKDEVLRAAFGQAYGDLVGFVKQINDSLYQEGVLTERGEKLVQALALAWSTAKTRIQEALDYALNNAPKVISHVESLAVALGTIASAAAKAAIHISDFLYRLENARISPTLLALMGAMMGGKLAGWQGALVGAGAGFAAGTGSQITGVTKTREELYGGGQSFGGYTEEENEAAKFVNNYREVNKQLSVQAQNAEGFAESLKWADEQLKEWTKKEYGPHWEFQYKTLKGFQPEAREGKAPSVPSIRKPPTEVGGAGGGGAKEAEKLQSLIDTLEKERARLSEGSFGAIIGWYNDIMKKIMEYQVAGLNAEEAISLARTVAGEKYEKEVENFNKWYASQAGDKEKQIDYEEKDILSKNILTQQGIIDVARMTGRTLASIHEENEKRKSQITEVSARKRATLEIDQEMTKNNLVKNYYEKLAQLTPVMSDQASYQEKALDLQQKIDSAALSKLLKENDYLKSLGNELRAMEALVFQAQKYEQARKGWMQQGVQGGLQVWAFDRQKEMAERPAKAMIEMMQESERMLADGLSGAIIDSLRGRQRDMSEVFYQAAEAGIKRSVSMMVASLYDQIAKWVKIPKLGAKPDGTPGNPLNVIVQNMPIGGKVGEGTDLFSGILGKYPVPSVNVTNAAKDWVKQGENTAPSSIGGWFWDDYVKNAPVAQQASTGLFGSIADWFKGLGSNLQGTWFGSILGTVGSVFGGIFDFFGSIGSAISGALGGGAGGGSFLSSIFSGLGGLFGFQHGGVVDKPTLALIGEAGREYVIPEKKFNQFVEMLPKVHAFAAGGYVDKPTLALIGERGPELVLPEGKISSIQDGILKHIGGNRNVSPEPVNIDARTYVVAPEPSKYQASREQLEAKRAESIRRALRNL